MTLQSTKELIDRLHTTLLIVLIDKFTTDSHGTLMQKVDVHMEFKGSKDAKSIYPI